MAEQTDSIVLEMLRRIRGSRERMELDIGELKSRVSAIDLNQGQVLLSLGTLNQHMGRFDERLSRIERRPDLVEA